MNQSITCDPDLAEVNRRLEETARDIDCAREIARRLLSALTDSQITIAAARRALQDFDERDKSTTTAEQHSVEGGAL